MGRRITDEQRLGAAYSIGKARQQVSLSISLIFINILIVAFMRDKMLGFNVAMFIISSVSLYANRATLKDLEKKFNLEEEELAAEKLI